MTGRTAARRCSLRRAVVLILTLHLVLLFLASCATGATGDGGAETSRRGEVEERVGTGELNLEPVIPVDGAPVTEVPVRITFRASTREGAADGAEADGAGPVARSGQFTISVFTDPEAPAETTIHRAEVARLEAIRVPAGVLVDGRTYHYRLEAATGARTDVFSFRLAVQAPVPKPSIPTDGAATFDRTPTLAVVEIAEAVEYEYELWPSSAPQDADAAGADATDATADATSPDASAASAQGGAGAAARRVSGPARASVSEPLTFGREYSWRVRSVFESGFRSAWSGASSFQVRRDFVVEPITAGFGLQTISLSPHVAVTPVPGAAGYRFELSEVGTDQPPLQVETDRPSFGVGTDTEDPLAPGTTYTLRVQVQNDTDDSIGWFGPFEFVGGAMDMAFEPVLPPGEEADFVMGPIPEPAPEERAEVPVRLTRPFAMAATETTNAQFVRVMNWALASGRARINEDRVLWTPSAARPPAARRDTARAPAAPAPDDEIILLYLDDLFVGTQPGVVTVPGPGGTDETAAAQASEPQTVEPPASESQTAEPQAGTPDATRLAAVAGRGDHPVVGVTWYGAVAFANYYSILTGESAVYDVEAESWDRSRAGYRLPTEAEWEYTATAAGERAYPWGQSLSAARANYFRSGDPFEAVTPPYTAGGGPTTPAAYYDGTNRNGYQTLSNLAPTGQYDLIGNVWEWCFDWYARGFGVPAGQDSDNGTMMMDPAGPPEGEPDEFGVLHRVVRGTGWNTRAAGVITRNRGRFDPGEGSYATGFRLLRDLPPPETTAETESAPPGPASASSEPAGESDSAPEPEPVAPTETEASSDTDQ